MRSEDYKRRFGVVYVASPAARKAVSRAITRWTPARIIAELRRLTTSAHGPRQLRPQRVATHRRLQTRCRYHFGSYKAALQAAGLDLHVSSRRFKWDRARLVAEIRSRRRQGLPLNANAVPHGIKRAAARHFGGYGVAIEAAGIRYATIRKTKPYDLKLIIRAIRKRWALGKPLNHKVVKLEDSWLAQGARLRFGSWDGALRAAGFDPKKIRFRKKWSPAEVISRIRSRSQSGQPMNLRAVFFGDSSLYAAACRYFGTWQKAVNEAALDYEAIRLRKVWTMQDVLDSIRRQAALGIPPLKAAMAERESTLPSIARRYFGTWRAAVGAAGLDPAGPAEAG